MLPQQHSTGDSFRGLIAAVISRALADLEKTNPATGIRDHVRDEAMAWINGPDCEAYCYALDVEYTEIRERAAALYRRFLESAEGRPRPRKRPGYRRGEGIYYLRG
jgi:hypothetical protein